MESEVGHGFLDLRKEIVLVPRADKVQFQCTMITKQSQGLQQTNMVLVLKRHCQDTAQMIPPNRRAANDGLQSFSRRLRIGLSWRSPANDLNFIRFDLVVPDDVCFTHSELTATVCAALQPAP